MDFQAFDKMLVCDDKIKNYEVNGRKYGYEIKMQYPSYRGTFLSCIEGLEVEIDGRAIDEKDMCLCVNGKEFLISELKELFKEYWFILDKATLRIMKNGGMTGKHEVKACMRHRIPYTGYFGGYLVLNSSCKKTLEVA
jgi:hypothetical protein